MFRVDVAVKNESRRELLARAAWRNRVGRSRGTIHKESTPQPLGRQAPQTHNGSRPALKRRLETAGSSVVTLPLLWGGTERQGAPRQDAWFHGSYPSRLSSCQPWLGLVVHGRPSDERLHTAERREGRRGRGYGSALLPSQQSFTTRSRTYKGRKWGLNMRRTRRRRQAARRQVDAALKPQTQKAKLYAALGEELKRQAAERAR